MPSVMCSVAEVTKSLTEDLGLRRLGRIEIQEDTDARYFHRRLLRLGGE